MEPSSPSLRQPGELMTQLKKSWSTIDTRWGRPLIWLSMVITLVVSSVGLVMTIKPCAFLGADAGDDCDTHDRRDGAYLGIALIASAIFSFWFSFNGIVHESRVETFLFVAMTLLLTARSAFSTIDFEGKRASKVDEPLHIAIFFTVVGLCMGTIILSAFSLEEFGYREMRVTGGNTEKKRIYGRAQLFLGFMKLDAQFCILIVAASLLRPVPPLGHLRDNILVAITSVFNLVFHITSIIGINNERHSLFVIALAAAPWQLLYGSYRMQKVIVSTSIWKTPQLVTAGGSIVTRLGCMMTQLAVWREFKGVLKTVLAKDDAPQYQALLQGIS